MYHVWSVRSEFFPKILFTQETTEWCKLKRIVPVPLLIYFVVLKQFSSSEVCRECENEASQIVFNSRAFSFCFGMFSFFFFGGGVMFLVFRCFIWLCFGFFFQIRVSTIAYSRREYKIRCQEKLRCLLNYNPLLCRITIWNECTIVLTCTFPRP